MRGQGLTGPPQGAKSDPVNYTPFISTVAQVLSSKCPSARGSFCPPYNLIEMDPSDSSAPRLILPPL